MSKFFERLPPMRRGHTTIIDTKGNRTFVEAALAREPEPNAHNTPGIDYVMDVLTGRRKNSGKEGIDL